MKQKCKTFSPLRLKLGYVCIFAWKFRKTISIIRVYYFLLIDSFRFNLNISGRAWVLTQFLNPGSGLVNLTLLIYQQLQPPLRLFFSLAVLRWRESRGCCCQDRTCWHFDSCTRECEWGTEWGEKTLAQGKIRKMTRRQKRLGLAHLAIRRMFTSMTGTLKLAWMKAVDPPASTELSCGKRHSFRVVSCVYVLLLWKATLSVALIRKPCEKN